MENCVFCKTVGKKKEIELVNKGTELEMQEIKEGKIKTKSIERIKKKYCLKI